MSAMSLEKDFVSLVKAKADAAALAILIAQLEKEVIDEMERLNLVRVSYQDDQIKGTLVQAERVVTSETELEKLVTVQMWNKITKRVLDKEKLEAMVVVGKISAATIASASEVKQNKAYVRVTGTLGVVVAGVKAPRKRNP